MRRRQPNPPRIASTALTSSSIHRACRLSARWASLSTRYPSRASIGPRTLTTKPISVISRMPACRCRISRTGPAGQRRPMVSPRFSQGGRIGRSLIAGTIEAIDKLQTGEGQMRVNLVNGLAVGINQFRHAAGGNGLGPFLVRSQLLAQHLHHPVDQPTKAIEHPGMDGLDPVSYTHLTLPTNRE